MLISARCILFTGHLDVITCEQRLLTKSQLPDLAQWGQYFFLNSHLNYPQIPKDTFLHLLFRGIINGKAGTAAVSFKFSVEVG